MTGEIDAVSSMLGELKAVTARTAETVDIIRSDQINARREIDFMKQKMVESSEMVDAMAPTLKEHHEILMKIKPLIPAMESVNAVDKAGKKGAKVIQYLGAAGFLAPIAYWLKNHIHFGP